MSHTHKSQNGISTETRWHMNCGMHWSASCVSFFCFSEAIRLFPETVSCSVSFYRPYANSQKWSGRACGGAGEYAPARLSVLDLLSWFGFEFGFGVAFSWRCHIHKSEREYDFRLYMDLFFWLAQMYTTQGKHPSFLHAHVLSVFISQGQLVGWAVGWNKWLCDCPLHLDCLPLWHAFKEMIRPCTRCSPPLKVSISSLELAVHRTVIFGRCKHALFPPTLFPLCVKEVFKKTKRFKV